MIAIGIGANLEHPEYGAPRRTCGAALTMLEDRGVGIVKCSTWYRTAPVLGQYGAQGEQPWYVNGAASVTTDRDAHALLDILLDIEQSFGRVRSIANAPRTLDLDVIAFNDQVLNDDGLHIPHPRMHERAFVLHPLRDLMPDWCHPVRKTSVAEMIRDLPPNQSFQAMPDADGRFATEWWKE